MRHRVERRKRELFFFSFFFFFIVTGQFNYISNRERERECRYVNVDCVLLALYHRPGSGDYASIRIFILSIGWLVSRRGCIYIYIYELNAGNSNV